MSTTENYQNDTILSFLANVGGVVKNLGAKLVAGRKVDEASVAGAWSPGVIRDTNDALDANNLDVGVVPGPCFKKVTSGAAFADLDALALDANGKYRTATAGQMVVAIAMELVGGADVTALAFILPPSMYRVKSANIAALVHAFGAADGTIVDVGGAFNQGTLNDNFKELSTKVNAILTLLQEQVLMT